MHLGILLEWIAIQYIVSFEVDHHHVRFVEEYVDHIIGNMQEQFYPAIHCSQMGKKNNPKVADACDQNDYRIDSLGIQFLILWVWMCPI